MVSMVEAEWLTGETPQNILPHDADPLIHPIQDTPINSLNSISDHERTLE